MSVVYAYCGLVGTDALHGLAPLPAHLCARHPHAYTQAHAHTRARAHTTGVHDARVRRAQASTQAKVIGDDRIGCSNASFVLALDKVCFGVLQSCHAQIVLAA